MGKKKVYNDDNIIDNLLKKVTPELQEEIDYKMDLAAKIYAGMKAKGWNKTQFATEMKKKNSVITKWLSGFHVFGTDTLFAIQNKLGIRLLDLEPHIEKQKEDNEPKKIENKDLSDWISMAMFGGCTAAKASLLSDELVKKGETA